MSELCPEPLVGFRSWGVDADGFLRPVHRRCFEPEWVAWERKAAAASCFDEHQVPDRDCMCGLHAYLEPTPYGGGRVHGAVVTWGRIVEHEEGFRAQLAQPVALLDDKSYDLCPRRRRFDTLSETGPATTLLDPRGTRAGAIERAAERYGLPVLPLNELIAYAGWFGELRAAPAADEPLVDG